MSYKPAGSDKEYKVLKQAGDTVLLNLLGYRNNEDLLQALPVTKVEKGSYIRFYNENAPTIAGYDFVCAVPNCFTANEDTTVKLYYIPQSIPYRTKTSWNNYFTNATGDLSKKDYANTYSATSMVNMFNGSSIIKPPKINTSNVTNMNGMFLGCAEMDIADLKSFDTTNVISMTSMFQNCGGIKVLDLSNFVTKNLQTLNSMFAGCSGITELDLSNFDTSKVTTFSALFNYTPALKTVKGTLDLSSCADVSYMFLATGIKGLHLKNVPRNLDLSTTSGTEGETYIIDNYI